MVENFRETLLNTHTHTISLPKKVTFKKLRKKRGGGCLDEGGASTRWGRGESFGRFCLRILVEKVQPTWISAAQLPNPLVRWTPQLDSPPRGWVPSSSPIGGQSRPCLGGGAEVPGEWLRHLRRRMGAIRWAEAQCMTAVHWQCDAGERCPNAGVGSSPGHVPRNLAGANVTAEPHSHQSGAHRRSIGRETANAPRSPGRSRPAWHANPG